MKIGVLSFDRLDAMEDANDGGRTHSVGLVILAMPELTCSAVVVTVGRSRDI